MLTPCTAATPFACGQEAKASLTLAQCTDGITLLHGSVEVSMCPTDYAHSCSSREDGLWAKF